MESQLEIALLAGLERLAAGLPVDEEWVWREFPGCARDVEDLLRLQRLLEQGRPSPERVGPYRLLRRLGRGGMGTVFLARSDDAESVAVKVLHRAVIGTPGGMERVLAEARAGTEVRHPNLVRLLDCGIDDRGVDPLVYLVFEAVAGPTLRAVLDDVGALPDSRARQVAAEVADALAAIHAKGLVHGDVKPENVILEEGRTVRLLDFGAVRPCPPSGDATDDTFVGSLLYAAPEQLAPGPDPIDDRADLYGLGLVLYELVTGRHPFGRARFPDDPSGSRPVPRDPRLSPFSAYVLDDLIALDRAERLTSAERLRDLLREGEESSYWRQRASREAGERHPHEAMPLRGRDADLAALRKAVDAGRTVLVEGMPGIGKTRLLDALCAGRNKDDGWLVLRGGFAEGHAFAAALRPHVAAGGLPLDERAVAILDAYACGESLAAGPSLQELQTTLARLMSTWSRERPVLVVIDDLHLADADGRALFGCLARLEEKTVALIGGTRPELPDAWRDGLLAEPSVEILSLGPLTSDAIQDVVTDLLGGTVSERLIRWCAEHSRGHPLLAREAVQWMRTTDGRLNDAGDAWDLFGDLSAVPPSDSAREITRARLDRLPVPVRDLLDSAACGGLRIDTELLAMVLGTPVRELNDQLARIEAAHGVVTRSGAGFVFDHQIVRDVLHNDLHPALRRQLHGRWSDALTTSAEKTDGATSVALVSHLIEAGRSEAARKLLDEAVVHLERSVRPHAALELIERVLDASKDGPATERVPLLRQRAERLLRLGRLDVFDSTMAEAWSLVDDIVIERIRLHDLNAKRALMAGDTRKVQTEVEAAFALVDREADAPPALLAALTHDLADVAWFDCRAADAHDLFVRAAELAHSGEDLELECRMRAMAGFSLILAVAPEKCFPECAEADRLARAVGPPSAQAFTRLVLAVALWQLGRTVECHGALGEALELCNRAGNRHIIVSIEVHRAHVLIQEGRFAEARSRVDSATRIAEELGAPGLIGACENCTGELHMALGEFAEAGAWYLKTARRGRRRGAKSAVEPISRIAQVRAAQGRHGESLRIFERVSDGMHDNQLFVMQAEFRIAFARACLAAGRLERARELARGARRCGEDGPGRPTESRALAVEAACAWQREDDDALQLTQRALDLAPQERPALRLEIARTAAGGWMAVRQPDASAQIAQRVAAETADYPAPWMRTLVLALAARESRGALLEARAQLEEYGHRLPLLDRIAAHVHLWLAEGDKSDLAAARSLLPGIDPVVDRTRADPVLARVAV
ncbi:MAG: protein kinase domain-containing protein [Planctomycetota bacterium]